jgi:ribosomal protein S27AE
MANDKKAETYTIHMGCTNCGHSGDVDIPRGTEADKQFCPHCGCRTMVRTLHRHECKKYGSTIAEVTDIFFNGH